MHASVQPGNPGSNWFYFSSLMASNWFCRWAFPWTSSPNWGSPMLEFYGSILYGFSVFYHVRIRFLCKAANQSDSYEPVLSKLTRSPVEKITQKSALARYRSAVSNRKPRKVPIRSTKNPAPIVPIIAAIVPAVFDIPVTNKKFCNTQTTMFLKLWSNHSVQVYNIDKKQSYHV